MRRALASPARRAPPSRWWLVPFAAAATVLVACPGERPPSGPSVPDAWERSDAQRAREDHAWRTAWGDERVVAAPGPASVNPSGLALGAAGAAAVGGVAVGAWRLGGDGGIEAGSPLSDERPDR